MIRNKNIKKYRHAGMHAGSNFQWRVPFLGLLYNSRPSAAVHATTDSDVHAAGCLTYTNSSGTGGGISTSAAATPSVFMTISAEAVSGVYVQEQEEDKEDKKQESPTAGVAGDIELGCIPESAPHQAFPQNMGGVYRT
jgi:hypothetical protein